MSPPPLELRPPARPLPPSPNPKCRLGDRRSASRFRRWWQCQAAPPEPARSDLRGLQTRCIGVIVSPAFRVTVENKNYKATMKKIDQDELYENLRGFLKSKGIALDSGTYTQRIHQGCNLLADAINLTQTTVARAKAEVDKKLDQLRHSIHEATAPKPPAASPGPEQSLRRAGIIRPT